MGKIGVAVLTTMMGLAAWNGVRAEGKVVEPLRPELGQMKIVGTLRLADPMYIIPLYDKVECSGQTYLVRFAKGADESLLKKLDGKKVVMNGHLGKGAKELAHPFSEKVTVFYCTEIHAADKDAREAATLTLIGKLTHTELPTLPVSHASLLTIGGQDYSVGFAAKDLKTAKVLDGEEVIVTATLDRDGRVVVTGLQPVPCQ